MTLGPHFLLKRGLSELGPHTCPDVPQGSQVPQEPLKFSSPSLARAEGTIGSLEALGLSSLQVWRLLWFLSQFKDIGWEYLQLGLEFQLRAAQNQVLAVVTSLLTVCPLS